MNRYLLSLSALLLSACAAAQDIVVVMGSEQRPYQIALEAFQRELGRPATVLSLREAGELPAGTKVVVALGGRAALRAYPPNVTLVYGLAPGIEGRANGSVKVQMTPKPATLLEKIKQLQPKVSRLAVLWQAAGSAAYVRELRRAAGQADLKIVERRLASAEQLPETLRSLVDAADAVWVPPDPLLITPSTLDTLKEFSWANGIPFYAPAASILDFGAVASIGSSFAEVGKALARAANDASEGRTAAGLVYPEQAVVAFNPKAAAQLGLKVPPAAATP